MRSQPSHFADTDAKLKEVVAAAEGRKAIDLKVLRLEEVSDFTDYFLICSGASERQVQAIADSVIEQLRKERVKPLSVEGLQNGRWVLLDFGDIVMHIFVQETRSFYGLERLWADAPDVTDEFRT